MLIQTISQYLKSHKRLVVPQLGAFIVKEPGQCVLFSELLKRDDGILRGLLCEQGVSEIEAAGEIDRFVFEVRHAVERDEEYSIEGLGVLRPGENGTIAFLYAPPPSEDPCDLRVPMHNDGELAFDNMEPSQPPRMRQSFGAECDGAASAKLARDPSLKGLRYSKPRKNTDAYTYVNHTPRRHIDRFVWIAVAAAVISMGAIAFGYFREARERRIEAAAQAATQSTTVTPTNNAQ